MFQRTADGMELIEIAPGIDLEKDILPHMSFKPIVRDPRPMNPLIFKPEPMGLEQLLLGLSLAERITYDQARNTIFINFEGFQVRTDRRRRPCPPRDGGALQGDWTQSCACRQL